MEKENLCLKSRSLNTLLVQKAAVQVLAVLSQMLAVHFVLELLQWLKIVARTWLSKDEVCADAVGDKNILKLTVDIYIEYLLYIA